MAHQDNGAAAEPPFGGPTPTPTPWTQQQQKSHRLKTALTWAALIVGLGLALYILALNTPGGPTGAARIKADCQFQYPNDKAGAAACVEAKGTQ